MIYIDREERKPTQIYLAKCNIRNCSLEWFIRHGQNSTMGENDQQIYSSRKIEDPEDQNTSEGQCFYTLIRRI